MMTASAVTDSTLLKIAKSFRKPEMFGPVPTWTISVHQEIAHYSDCSSHYSA
jgi:hypothetical protein